MQPHMNEAKVETHTMSAKGTDQRKKAYHAPRLIRYGDFQHLTMGGGGIKKDNTAGNPKTKATGGP